LNPTPAWGIAPAKGAAASRPPTTATGSIMTLRHSNRTQHAATGKPNRSWLLACTRIYMHTLLEYRNMHARITSRSVIVPTYGKVFVFESTSTRRHREV
jgi:hypothetical protein